MKLVVISDVHGRKNWKRITTQNKDADLFIFIGDYFDSFDIHANEQILNFREIILFKEKNPDKVILLTGNHDTHYLPYFINTGERYSGFQGAMFHEINHLIQDNLSYLQMAFQYADILFTHAGVTNTWLNDNGFDKKSDVVQFINDLFIYKPSAFRFVGTDPYGDSQHSSPVWVRPGSLMSNAYKYDEIRQVVGHTQYKQILIIKDHYCFTDAPDSGEYLSIIDDQFLVRSTH